jgi:hypothetical protein
MLDSTLCVNCASGVERPGDLFCRNCSTVEFGNKRHRIEAVLRVLDTLDGEFETV